MVMVMDYFVICLIKENYRYIPLKSKKSVDEFEQIIVIRSNKIDYFSKYWQYFAKQVQ